MVYVLAVHCAVKVMERLPVLIELTLVKSAVVLLPLVHVLEPAPDIAQPVNVYPVRVYGLAGNEMDAL